jgi:hypothetical protein
MKTQAILTQPDEAGGIFLCFPLCRVFILCARATSATGRYVSITIPATFSRIMLPDVAVRIIGPKRSVREAVPSRFMPMPFA